MAKHSYIYARMLQGWPDIRQSYRKLMVDGHESLKMEVIRETVNVFLVILLIHKWR